MRTCSTSTHIESNMAKFGRMKLMATAIRRFLVQVKRHDEGSYNALRKAVHERYEASDQTIFGWKSLDDDGVNQLRQSIAEDLAYLVERYRRNKEHNGRSTYLMLVKVFEQQCEVVDEKVIVKKQTGGNIVCNPSDPDASQAKGTQSPKPDSTAECSAQGGAPAANIGSSPPLLTILDFAYDAESNRFTHCPAATSFIVLTTVTLKISTCC